MAPRVITAPVIISFADRETADIYDGRATTAARAACPEHLWPVARRKLDQINRVATLRELAKPPGNRLEKLRGSRTGQYSVRINQQYRVCFRWEEGDAYEVQVTDYH